MSNRIYGKPFANKRRNPNWLVRIFRAIGKWRRDRETYNFYLSLGCSPQEARDKVGKTL